MAKRMDSGDKGQAKLKDLVVLTLVSDIDQAKEYETLLKLNDRGVIKLPKQAGTSSKSKSQTPGPTDS